MTVKSPEAAKEVLKHLLLHLLLLEELESDCLLVLPHLLEHEHLGLLLSGLLSQDPSLSICLSALLLGEATLLICKCLKDLSKRVRHCNLSHCNWWRCRGPNVMTWCYCPGCTGLVVVCCTSDLNSRNEILVVL